MAEEREKEGGTTESTERIPPGSMPPDEDSKTERTDDEKADEESKESFPASDPPSW